MSYNSIFNSLGTASDWFINRFLIPFFDFIESTPLISAAIMITVGLPLVLLVLISIANFSHSAEDFTYNESNRMFLRSSKLYRKIHKKQIYEERERQKTEAQALANEFFSNNPNRMSVTVNGFRFMQDGFEKKKWGNSKRARVTKTYSFDKNGEMYVSRQSISSTESYDNTSDLQFYSEYDPD